MAVRFSVALATYRGARYLPGLLDSLLGQSLPPCELIAADDASEDGTVALLEAFAASAPFPVRILSSSQRMGVTDNFSRAIAACSGDFVALADQDDIWQAGKLEKLSAALVAPGVQAVFSDAQVVDADLIPLGYTMWDRVRFTSLEQARLARGEGFAVQLKHRIVTGATLAFNAGLRDIALPIPANWPHDAWLSLLAAASGGLVAIPEPMIAYRQHAANVVGGRRKSFTEEMRAALTLDRAIWYQQEISLWRALAERLPVTPGELVEKLAHLDARANLPASRWLRGKGVLQEVLSGGYAKYARNWGSIAIDLLVK
jgi:glycosyltransferase involved in cell wall biosynthesis